MHAACLNYTVLGRFVQACSFHNLSIISLTKELIMYYKYVT